MNLPDHGGLHVLDSLKGAAETRHIPVHVMSVDDVEQRVLEMGAVGYLRKPTEPAALAAVLEQLRQRLASVRRLLLVEDDKVQRGAMRELLHSQGVDIDAVGTVKEALDRLARSTYDCVVVDLALPDGTGFDLLEKMANEDALSFPPVIVYTGRSLSADEEQRLRRYSSSIIVKGARSPERLLDEVTLFLHQVEAELPPDRQKMLQQARLRETVFDGKTVLLVEDDVRNIFALSSVLEPRGLRLVLARNGKEALKKLTQEQEVHLVLMDLMMPEMDGLEATRAIRALPKPRGAVPIIALTAKAMPDDRQKCLEAGANDYIAKPLDVDMLLSMCRVWIQR
jgi:CheY-like chemotaxis protein